MRYGKTHAESEILKIRQDSLNKEIALLFLPRQIKKLKKRVTKLEKKLKVKK